MLKQIPKKEEEVKETKKTCTVRGCGARREGGDLLFCNKCRKNWKSVCIQNGILEKQVNQSDLDGFLKEFQKEGLAWRA